MHDSEMHGNGMGVVPWRGNGCVLTGVIGRVPVGKIHAY